jgi:hypothetical protein
MTHPDAWVQMPQTDAGPMDRLISTHDRIGTALKALIREVMYESEYLSRRECEMVAAVTAIAQDCHY